MNSRPKWITINGVLKLNPDYQGNTKTNSSTVAHPEQAIAIVSNIYDAQNMQNIKLSEATSDSVSIIQSQAFLEGFQTNVNGSDVLEGLSSVFDQYEMPLGLINKVLDLSENNLIFIVDDSSSMNGSSDVLFKDASEYIRRKYDPQNLKANNPTAKLTRWQEAEDRLYILTEIIKHIPIQTLTIHFLNRSQPLVFEHRGKDIATFGNQVIAAIDQAFNTKPHGMTPLYTVIYREFMKDSTGAKTRFYIMTDGAPSDIDNDLAKIKDLIVCRGLRPNINDPEALYREIEKRSYEKPVSLLSCTDQSREVAWMKEIEGIALCTSESDDFHSERAEVEKAQGPIFPYSRGMDLICQLTAATNPLDLDALDEGVLTKATLDNLHGRVIYPQEYQNYLATAPKARGMSAQELQQYAQVNMMARNEEQIRYANKVKLMEYLRNTPGMQPPMQVLNTLNQSMPSQSTWQSTSQSSQLPYQQNLPPYNPQYNAPWQNQTMPSAPPIAPNQSNTGYATTPGVGPVSNWQAPPPVNQNVWNVQHQPATPGQWQAPPATNQNLWQAQQPGMPGQNWQAPPATNQSQWQTQQPGMPGQQPLQYNNNANVLFNNNRLPPQAPSAPNQQPPMTPNRRW